MNSNDSDQDLRTAFARQRRLDHAEAPAWNPSCLQARAAPAPFRRTWRLWAPISIAAAACLALSFVVFLDRPAPSLVKELPVLLPSSPTPERLLASLESSPWDTVVTTSDFLLPTHLTISMP